MKCQASDDPGSYFSWVGETSRVVLPTPTWRLGVQCGGSVRDLIDPQRPHERTKGSWPDPLGMEAGAPCRPTADASVQAVATGRRTAGANPLTPGNLCEGGPHLSGWGSPFFWMPSIVDRNGPALVNPIDN